jgi:hypothetical protein
VRLRSFKLRLHEGHVRALPHATSDGAPFAGPGVDLYGETAREAFAHAAPLLTWVAEREAGLPLRSMSIDLFAARALMTFDVEGGKPVVVRVVAPESTDLLERAKPVVAYLEARAQEVIAQRDR